MPGNKHQCIVCSQVIDSPDDETYVIGLDRYQHTSWQGCQKALRGPRRTERGKLHGSYDGRIANHPTLDQYDNKKAS